MWAKVDLLLIDQASFGASSIADYLSIPFITVTSTLMLNREESIPPFNFGWTYSTNPWAKFRNKLGYKLLDNLIKPIIETVNSIRQSWNLPPFQKSSDAYSTLAQICRQPVEFEYPRQQLPEIGRAHV